jgi:hypothetical protein
MSDNISLGRFHELKPLDTNDKSAYIHWRRYLLDFARSIDDARPSGLQGLLVYLPELRQLEDNVAAVEFAPRTNPDRPALDAVPLAGTFYMDDRAAFLKQHALIKAMHSALLRIIHPDILESLGLRDAITGYAHVTARSIIRALDNKLNKLTLEDYAANKAILDVPFQYTGDPGALTTYFASHANAATVAARHGLAFTEVYRVLLLIQGLSPCGRYTDALTRFQDSEDDLTDLTVAHLQTAVERADARLRLATTADMRLSAAAAASAPVIDYTALAAAVANHSRPTTTPSTTATDPVYCWTHGVPPECSHPSHACQKRLPGHVADATFSDRKGGWPHRQHSKSRGRKH